MESQWKRCSDVAQRSRSNTNNIYKVSVADGKETALTTNTSGNVDGPEYSPDGKYIIIMPMHQNDADLEMKPDGSEKEQLTFDQYHNWFPHISPDANGWYLFHFRRTLIPMHTLL